MFPHTVFLGLDLYWWMVVVGVISAMVAFRLAHEQAGVSAKVFNFCVLILVAAIAVGYVFAVLFQSWYVYIETGVFEWGIGATFYGGFIGGVLTFFIGYFGVGHFVFKDKRHIAELNDAVSVMLPCVALAQGFGRIGCLFEGCCYGVETDGALGINVCADGVWSRRVPVQLYEALFMFALFFVLIVLRAKKNCEYTGSIYLIAYGAFRFIIEFWRDDVRGASGIPFLSPSQLTAILLVIIGVAYIFVYKYFLKKVLSNVAQKYGEYAKKHEEAPTV